MALTNQQIINQLKARRDVVIGLINNLDETRAGGLPNTSGDGLNVDHQGYKKGLYEELEMIDKQLSSRQPGIVLSQQY